MALKRLEQWAKTSLAVLAGVLFRRWGRQQWAKKNISNARKILIVRLDNRVGEALLSTPLFSSLKAMPNAPQVDVLLHEKVVRVVKGHPDVNQVMAYDRRRWFLGPWAPGVRQLRHAGYDVVIHASNWTAPSVTGALVARLISPFSAVVGFNVFPVRWLQDINVPIRQDTSSEVLQRVHLLSVLPNHQGVPTLSFRKIRETQRLSEWKAAQLAQRPYAVINPGGRLGVRRVPVEVFVRAASMLSEKGMVPVVTWGPNEEALAQEVVKHVPGAVLALASNIDELASLMRDAQLTVCNNTGPMHLSVAVGTPTLALFLHMPMNRWGHFYGPHRMLDLTPALENGVPLARVLEEELNLWIGAIG